MKALEANKVDGNEAYTDGMVWLWRTACRGWRGLLRRVGSAERIVEMGKAEAVYREALAGGPGVRAVWSEYGAVTTERGRWRGSKWESGPVVIDYDRLGARNAKGEVVWVARAKVEAVRALVPYAWFAVRKPKQAVLVMTPEGEVAGLVMPLTVRE